MSAAPARRAESSRAAKIAGGTALVTMLALCELLVFQLRGLSPATFNAAAIGTFLGLISLAIEIGMVERSARTFHAQGVQSTFLSFVMRVVVVAPLTLLFMKPEVGLDHEAFAISYCATFFLYLCWLTWETYHAPAQYRPKAASASPAEIVVRDNRRSVGSAR